MIRRPPRSTLFPTRRSSDLAARLQELAVLGEARLRPVAQREQRLLGPEPPSRLDRKSTRLNSSHVAISYAVFCLKKKKTSTPCDMPHKQYHHTHISLFPFHS